MQIYTQNIVLQIIRRNKFGQMSVFSQNISKRLQFHNDICKWNMISNQKETKSQFSLTIINNARFKYILHTFLRLLYSKF